MPPRPDRYLSPFRYPGGKSWLVPTVTEWLDARPRPSLFLEAFAGGASIGLAVAQQHLADHVLLVELDPDIATVWATILTDGERFADQVRDFTFTDDNVRTALAATPATPEDAAFRTLLHNRVSRGGVMAVRAGLLRNGERGKGLASRWYPDTLATRIRALHALRHRLELRHGDGIAALDEHACPGVTAFVDPPYTASAGSAGRRLYRHSELDHEALFTACARYGDKVLLTYDDAPEVRRLAAAAGFTPQPISMRTSHHRTRSELLLAKPAAEAALTA